MKPDRRILMIPVMMLIGHQRWRRTSRAEHPRPGRHEQNNARGRYFHLGWFLDVHGRATPRSALNAYRLCRPSSHRILGFLGQRLDIANQCQSRHADLGQLSRHCRQQEPHQFTPQRQPVLSLETINQPYSNL